MMPVKTDESMNLSELGNIIGAAVAQGIAATQPRKEIREGDPEYVERQRAEGWFDTFAKPVFQNGFEAQARGLSAEVRERACQLRPGTYLRGRVRVDVWGNGSVNLRYPTNGDAMLINRDYFLSFSDLITKIWDEMHAGVPA